MTDSSSVSSGLAALGATGWAIAAPGTKTHSTGAETTEQSGVAQTIEQGIGTGDHGIGNAGQYTETTPGCTGSVIAPNAADVAVSAGVPARLFGIYGANGVVNGSQVVIKDGTTVIETFPAGSIPVTGIDFKGMKFTTALVVNITVAAGTSIKLLWGPLLT